MTIKDILVKYHEKLDYLDLELIIAGAIKKSREFVLAHPEYQLTTNQKLQITKLIRRRRHSEPLAYIFGHKEFFGLNFKVNKHTLIPRPETELLVELALHELRTKNCPLPTSVMDIGTGSGNIIISLAKNIHDKNIFYASDISKEALRVAKQNAKTHKVDQRIKFLHGSLLDPILKTNKLQITNWIILANLPYLSKKIYDSTKKTVKKFEPKSALYSPQDGLAHYAELLAQIKLLVTDYELSVTVLLEISPEQKPKITNLIRSILPAAKPEFFRDLAGKWRLCKISL